MSEHTKRIYTAFPAEGQPIDFSRAHKAEIDCYPWDDGDGYRPRAYGQVVYDRENLFVRLACRERDPLVTYDRPNQPVYQDSCLEFFINPTPERDTFMDFELNAAGVLLLGHYRDGDFRLLDPESRPDFDIRCERDPAEGWWSVQLRIPFSFLREVFGLDGDCPKSMAVNLYKCGDHTTHPHYGCWSPIPSGGKPDFFRSDCFGTLLLCPAVER